MELVDTHCHLDEDAFTPDRAEVVERALQAGVTQMLTIGTTLESSRRALEVSRIFPQVFAVVGIQPNYVHEARTADWDEIVELAADPRVLALGETGLDHYWKKAPLDLQIDYFARHMALSRTIDKPFVVHCREAEADVVAQLRRAAADGPLRGVMHSFTGSAETAAACLELGLFISFAGMVTFKSGQGLKELSAQIPLDRLLVETDSPYLAPSPHRGKRNEPLHVRLTAAAIAQARGISLDELAINTTRNARALFRLPDAT